MLARARTASSWPYSGACGWLFGSSKLGSPKIASVFLQPTNKRELSPKVQLAPPPPHKSVSQWSSQRFYFLLGISSWGIDCVPCIVRAADLWRNIHFAPGFWLDCLGRPSDVSHLNIAPGGLIHVSPKGVSSIPGARGCQELRGSDGAPRVHSDPEAPRRSAAK